MAVTGVGHQNQVRASPPETGIVQAEAASNPGSEILQDHIADGNEVQQDSYAFFRAQIKGETALAPVEGLEGAGPVPEFGAGAVVGIRAGDGAGGIDEGRMVGVNLDYLGAHVGQVCPHIGHGKDPAEVHNAYAGKG